MSKPEGDFISVWNLLRNYTQWQKGSCKNVAVQYIFNEFLMFMCNGSLMYLKTAGCSVNHSDFLLQIRQHMDSDQCF